MTAGGLASSRRRRRIAILHMSTVLVTKIGFQNSLCINDVNKKTFARCLKITEKISFNIASEASYVYILSGQKLIKNAKNGPFWRVFENLKLAVK